MLGMKEDINHVQHWRIFEAYGPVGPYIAVLPRQKSARPRVSRSGIGISVL